ncbi:dihydrodipicolinate synthase family protein [Haloarcula japonica]|uniref:Dihydrodipicolinate synthase n=1 Tax=Haloarcula japonica (strain ATCC 49778 / DSM 6131 / JCM 7785 / NBRC 101032 / NCIMB 13157 / TR-1) TaxID=1227453 RepID=M0LE66_HALJT|nr:dihydrodipicolinate synthase family protein [Haloarcula japonica]EMA30255.1 dihydrodipicolinate synthase [Haloarcula japonica DSM 6131]
MADSFDVLTPLVTPFDADGDLDIAGLESLVRHVSAAGVDGIVPCGTTGEFETLSPQEYRTVVRAATETAPDDCRVMVGTAATDVATVHERMAFADDQGADSTLVVPPYYGGQASGAGNEAFFDTVLADAPLPVYLYNIPGAVGQELSVETVAALAQSDAVAGLKDSSGDLPYVTAVMNQTPEDFTVYQGHDGLFVPSLVLGGDGGVSALSHLLFGELARAGTAVASGDIEQARAVQRDVLSPLSEACAEYGFAPTVKALLADRGIIDHATVRPPRASLPSDAVESVTGMLE